MRPRRADTSEPACTKRKMLSMKRRTSWPCSRKYSAMVRPERPTRRRAPGGSFICPKTSAVFSITPDSFISSQRSLPSRERSPTPAKTDRPSCSSAMFRMSSWMRTVLPTPAPPKRPTLPPFTYGASRSMTLMPVSKTSVVGCSSSKVGASRWIGQRSSALTSSPSSMTSPRTLKILRRVASPTGTLIGAPVSSTSIPRASPSVVSMATARTRSLPRCWWTSAIRSKASRRSCFGILMRSALLMEGRPPWKTASMTTPLISTILPVILSAMNPPVACRDQSIQALRPGPRERLDEAFGRLAGYAVRRRDRLLRLARQLAQKVLVGAKAELGASAGCRGDRRLLQRGAHERAERSRRCNRDDRHPPADRKPDDWTLEARVGDLGLLERHSAHGLGGRGQPDCEGTAARAPFQVLLEQRVFELGELAVGAERCPLAGALATTIAQGGFAGHIHSDDSRAGRLDNVRPADRPGPRRPGRSPSGGRRCPGLRRGALIRPSGRRGGGSPGAEGPARPSAPAAGAGPGRAPRRTAPSCTRPSARGRPGQPYRPPRASPGS